MENEQVENPLVELRCPTDGKLLLKVSDIAGMQLEVKCSRCGEVITTKRVDNDEN